MDAGNLSETKYCYACQSVRSFTIIPKPTTTEQHTQEITEVNISGLSLQAGMSDCKP